MAECPAPNEFVGENMGDLLQHDIAVVQSYNECRERHKALVDTLK